MLPSSGHIFSINPARDFLFFTPLLTTHNPAKVLLHPRPRSVFSFTVYRHLFCVTSSAAGGNVMINVAGPAHARSEEEEEDICTHVQTITCSAKSSLSPLENKLITRKSQQTIENRDVHMMASPAVRMFWRLEGLFCVYKPPGVHWKLVRDNIETTLLKGEDTCLKKMYPMAHQTLTTHVCVCGTVRLDELMCRSTFKKHYL